MIKLVTSKERQRKIRQDDVPELAIPTFTVVREAIKAGRLDEALEFLDYAEQEDMRGHDAAVESTESYSRYLAENYGEEEILRCLRRRYQKKAEKDWLLTPTPEGLLQRGAEAQRAHHGNFTITEEPDRYVVRLDPCGTGGRLWRSKGLEGIIGVTRKAYPWSWGRTGVPYYCCHCAIVQEIIPIEMRGYPTRISIPGQRPEDPCIHYYYKKPELIPEEYFLRVGKSKKIK